MHHAGDGAITITSVDEQLIQKCLEYIEKNMDNPEYGVEELSGDLGMEMCIRDRDHAASQFKIGTELLIYYHKFFLQGEYIRAHLKREKGFENYTAQGAYLQCSWRCV